jgi:threonine/homoserine/homoserine lactone efflux protein
LSIAAPVGPIGVLCIRRTVSDGRLVGWVSGLGAATADALYGAVAGFGLSVVSEALVSQRLWLHLLGGAFLCYLGVKTWRSVPGEVAAGGSALRLAGAYSSTLLLTLSNPATIISFAAVFAGLGAVAPHGDLGLAGALVLGVYLGSALWWSVLSVGVSLLRTRVDARMMRWVNCGSGLVICGFGVIALVTAGL